MFILDTMVVSEGFKLRPSPTVVPWLNRTEPASLFVSVLTFGEIEAGIEKKRRSDGAFDRLEEWLEGTRIRYEDRTLPITTSIAMRWGRLHMSLQRKDPDLLIAATALEHDLAVVTRNVRHFEPTGVKLLNPYEA